MTAADYPLFFTPSPREFRNHENHHENRNYNCNHKHFYNSI